MKKPIVFMYSGQGAQYFHMGRELYENVPVFRTCFDRASDVVEPLVGASLSELVYRESAKKFDPFEQTRYTHPANVIFSLALTETLMDRGIQPDMLLGYSLGEYTACLVAQALALPSGLENIVRQALMLEAKAPQGGMMAILENPRIMHSDHDLFRDCWLAARNFDQHFVVTARPDALKSLESELQKKRITCQILPVSHGFHSPLVDPIESDCITLFNDFAEPEIPIISTCTAAELEIPDGRHIWSVIRSPVRFLETVRAMEGESSYVYIDVGPAGTLSTFLRYILGPESNSTALVTVNQFGKDLASLQKLEDALGRERLR